VNEFQWKSMRSLPEVIRRGKSIEAMPEEVSRSIKENNGCVLQHVSNELFSILSLWASRKKSLYVLDLGCGNGLVGFSLAQKLPNVKLWSLDSINTLSIARGLAERMKLTSRVSYIEFDLDTFTGTEENQFQGPFDVIIVGQNIMNFLGKSKANELLRHISDALKSTGRVVFNEILSELEPFTSPYVQLHSLLMMTTLQKGKVHTVNWFKDLLSDTGFVDPTIHNLHPFPEKLVLSYRNIINKLDKTKKKT